MVQPRPRAERQSGDDEAALASLNEAWRCRPISSRPCSRRARWWRSRTRRGRARALPRLPAEPPRRQRVPRADPRSDRRGARLGCGRFQTRGPGLCARAWRGRRFISRRGLSPGRGLRCPARRPSQGFVQQRRQVISLSFRRSNIAIARISPGSRRWSAKRRHPRRVLSLWREDDPNFRPYVAMTRLCRPTSGRISITAHAGAPGFFGRTASATTLLRALPRHRRRGGEGAAAGHSGQGSDRDVLGAPARTRIPPHTGSTNARITVHLPLVVPLGCRFRVGAETREVARGRGLGVRRHDRARGLERKRAPARDPDPRRLEPAAERSEREAVRRIG